MQQFLVLFREEDGRTGAHEPDAVQQHRRNVQQWMGALIAQKRWVDGYPLTLTGKVIRGPRVSAAAQHSTTQPITHPAIPPGTQPAQQVSNGPYAIGTEIVGGYIILRAADLEEAASIIRDCPILDFDGFAEIRELMGAPDTSAPNATPNAATPNDATPDTDASETSASAATAATSNAGASATAMSPTAMTIPSSGASDTPDLRARNKQIVRRFNSAFIQQGDIAAFHEIVDPQVINHTAPAGMSKGSDGIRDLILLFRSALPDLTVEIVDQVAEGDLVVTRKYFHATHTAPVMGIPPSGRKITIPVIDIIRLRNGKYVEHWGIRDMSDLQRQASP